MSRIIGTWGLCEASMYEIEIADTFRAAHQLRMPDGTLEDLHEHDWHTRIVLAGHALDDAGLLVDFHPVKAALQAVLQDLAGGSLNDHAAFADRNPSAEHVAQHIADSVALDLRQGVWLKSVQVEEEPGCWARYLVQQQG
jgi:6-pyruvoyltetrahydropterin/6-carboxytetrahydropterin synthase